MRRLGSAVTLLLLVASGCSADDALSTGDETRTTVPSVTSSTTAAPSDPDTDTDTDPPTDPAPSPTSSSGTPSDDDAAAPPTPTAASVEDFEALDVTVELVAELDQPIDAVVAPNGEWWIAERHGGVYVVDPDTGQIGDTVFDINDETGAAGERGLLGLAVDDTALYVNFTDRSGDTQIEAVPLGSDGRPGERVHLLSIPQPFSNHNGGALAIGPDGRLYIGVGDGGRGGDPLGAGQDPEQILGSILRIDPTPAASTPYAVPTDNPFATGGGVPEIFMTGLRNPWRISFDSATGDLWIADVGQDRWEEVTLLLEANGWGLGANLGWNLREGIDTFSGERPDGNVDPVFVYGRSGDVRGCSITGGEVYRGEHIPGLLGAYVFGDYCTAQLWAISVATGNVVFVDLDVALPGGDLVDFSVDPNGELVALSLSGSIVRIVPS